MTCCLAVGRVALGLVVITFLHFPQEEHLAAKAHDGAGSTTECGLAGDQRALKPPRSAPLVLEHMTVIAETVRPRYATPS